MKMNLRSLNLPGFRRNRMSDEQRRILMISGIVIGAAALLTYPAILLYRRIRDKRMQANQQNEESTGKSFAPSYRGNHKPHHRKAEANGHVQQAHA
jgi:hypothetical protein